MKLKILVGLVIIPFLLNAATKSNRSDGLIQQKLIQERIGITLDRVSVQLDSVIGEYDRNGLEGKDVNALKRFSAVLPAMDLRAKM